MFIEQITNVATTNTLKKIAGKFDATTNVDEIHVSKTIATRTNAVV